MQFTDHTILAEELHPHKVSILKLRLIIFVFNALFLYEIENPYQHKAGGSLSHWQLITANFDLESMLQSDGSKYFWDKNENIGNNNNYSFTLYKDLYSITYKACVLHYLI